MVGTARAYAGLVAAFVEGKLMSRGAWAALATLAVLILVAVGVTSAAIQKSLSQEPPLPMDRRFPAFRELSPAEYTLITDTSQIAQRFSPLGVTSAVSVVGERGPQSLQWSPDNPAKVWYHAVLQLDESSQEKLQKMYTSAKAHIPAIHPRLYDAVPQECVLPSLKIPDPKKEATAFTEFQSQLVSSNPEWGMRVRAVSYCSQKGILIVEADALK